MLNVGLYSAFLSSPRSMKEFNSSDMLIHLCIHSANNY